MKYLGMLFLLPALAFAGETELFVEFSHDSLLMNPHDYGHHLLGVGVEHRMNNFVVSGKLSRPVFAQESHTWEDGQWNDEDIVGSVAVRYNFWRSK
jgi:hypothetical protein